MSEHVDETTLHMMSATRDEWEEIAIWLPDSRDGLELFRSIMIECFGYAMERIVEISLPQLDYMMLQKAQKKASANRVYDGAHALLGGTEAGR